jgi:2-methylisocitrate lyase-like PEP mutase family enzyme
MDQHVAVGMRDQAVIMLNAHAAQNDVIASAERVNVIADADAHQSEPQSLAATLSHAAPSGSE